MKQPDEIKKGLNCNNIDHCNECPYDGLDCAKHVDQDALAYIQQLEETIGSLGHLNVTMHNEAKKGIQELESRLAQVERERDAAVSDLNLMAWNADEMMACVVCGSDSPLRCEYCKNRSEEAFIWRGVCPENTKEE